MLGNLQKENALLKDSETRLAKERDMLRSEMHSNTVLNANIELIKVTLDRRDAESKFMLEEQLKDAHRECAAIRRRLQEEQDNFRQLTTHLEKKTQHAQERMEEESRQAEKLRKELADVREDLVAKSQQIEELSKKLRLTMLAGSETNPESKKYKDLQKMYEDSQTEIEALQKKLKLAKDAVLQHCNVAEASEKQLQEVLEQQKRYQEEAETKIKEQEKIIEEFKEKCSELEGELSIQNDGQESVSKTMRSKMEKLENTHLNNINELEQAKKDLDAAQAEIKDLSERLTVTEEKYSREMMLHSNDLQALTTAREELVKVTTELNEIRHQRDQALESLTESKASWEIQENLFKKEKHDLEARFKNLDEQNTLLLDQLQALNTQLSIMQSQTLNESQNISMEASFNRSAAEDDGKSSEQLLKIIKYLRQEKDIAVSKCDILEAEHARLKAQENSINQQLAEAKAALESERQKSETSLVTSAKHAEVLRKVETLHAVIDSNRSLRTERDVLSAQVTELTNRCKVLEEELAPVQEKQRELNVKVDTLQSENSALRQESTRWRQRANMLIEKSNRTSPEDWKKLQNERENLAKQLTIERGNTAKLTDDLSNVRQEKGRLEDIVKQLRQQIAGQKQEIEHLSEELGAVRTQLSQLNEDMERVTASYNKIQEEHKVCVLICMKQ